MMLRLPIDTEACGMKIQRHSPGGHAGSHESVFFAMDRAPRAHQSVLFAALGAMRCHESVFLQYFATLS